MDKFQEKYIKLSKDYYKNNGNAASVEALYQFKEELEASEDMQAKSVLVDIYQLLSMQKNAYELLLKIHDKNDKKQLKTLGYLAQFLDEGDKWAVPRPKSKEQILAQKAKAATLPKFRYHPEPLKTGAFKDDMSVICECLLVRNNCVDCFSVSNLFLRTSFFIFFLLLQHFVVS